VCEFQYRRDEQNPRSTTEQCYLAFPGLFEDINRAVYVHIDMRILADDLDAMELDLGMVHVMTFDGKARLGFDPKQIQN
jgi:hypothetical protein